MRYSGTSEIAAITSSVPAAGIRSGRDGGQHGIVTATVKQNADNARQASQLAQKRPSGHASWRQESGRRRGKHHARKCRQFEKNR